MATPSSGLAWRIPGTGSLVGCHLWGHAESDMTAVTQQQQHSGGWQLFGKSAASRSLWINSELKMGDPFWVGKPLSLHVRMFE